MPLMRFKLILYERRYVLLGLLELETEMQESYKKGPWGKKVKYVGNITNSTHLTDSHFSPPATLHINWHI